MWEPEKMQKDHMKLLVNNWKSVKQLNFVHQIKYIDKENSKYEETEFHAILETEINNNAIHRYPLISVKYGQKYKLS